jgi:hypothetical protein
MNKFSFIVFIKIIKLDTLQSKACGNVSKPHPHENRG